MRQILRGKLLQNVPARTRLCASAAPIALLACLTSGATMSAYTPAEAQEKPGELGPVIVASPRRQVAPRVQVQAKRAPAAGSVRRAQRQQAPFPVPTVGAGAASPLNGNTDAPGASRLGLTVSEISATVEVIDQRTIRCKLEDLSRTRNGLRGLFWPMSNHLFQGRCSLATMRTQIETDRAKRTLRCGG
jgi:hypothetical protein